jgi:hypothetical protein
MNTLNATQSLLEKLTQTVYLDRVLKIAGVAGFVITYLNAWRSMGLGTCAMLPTANASASAKKMCWKRWRFHSFEGMPKEIRRDCSAQNQIESVKCTNMGLNRQERAFDDRNEKEGACDQRFRLRVEQSHRVNRRIELTVDCRFSSHHHQGESRSSSFVRLLRNK